MIAVHVLGAVRKPGVVELPAGSRVQDALHAADGANQRADLGDLNLAQPLADGQQVFIARAGGVSEVRDPGGGGGAAASGSGAGAGSSSESESAASVVNLNTATSEELDQLPGVGPVTAQKILTWRDQNGTFSSVEELQEIDGIGPKTFAELAPLVTV
jgi:competence protein ComEA